MGTLHTTVGIRAQGAMQYIPVKRVVFDRLENLWWHLPLTLGTYLFLEKPTESIRHVTSYGFESNVSGKKEGISPSTAAKLLGFCLLALQLASPAADAAFQWHYRTIWVPINSFFTRVYISYRCYSHFSKPCRGHPCFVTLLQHIGLKS